MRMSQCYCFNTQCCISSYIMQTYHELHNPTVTIVTLNMQLNAQIIAMFHEHRIYQTCHVLSLK